MSHNIINVLIVVNGDLINQKISDKVFPANSTINNPVNIGYYASQSDAYISMITESGNVVSSLGKSDLIIKGDSGDEIQWNMTTFDNNADYTAFLIPEKSVFNPQGVISNPTGDLVETYVYLPNGNGAVSKHINYEYDVTSKIKKVKTNVVYTLVFQLYDNSNGKSLGYFTWDPGINVN